MISPIDQLEEVLWGACVIQRAPANEETVERWQTDELAHLRERFLVRPLPAELADLAGRALAQWQEREQSTCSRLGLTCDAFLRQFATLREDYLNGGHDWRQPVALLAPAIHGAVRNMDWVNLFSWVLPNADRERAEAHRMVGRMVVALFYFDKFLIFLGISFAPGTRRPCVSNSTPSTPASTRSGRWPNHA